MTTYVTCGTCTRYIPNPKNPEAGMGKCDGDHWRGTYGRGWPGDTRSTPPYPLAERVCRQHEGKVEAR